MSIAERIVNDRTLTSVSRHLNDLLLIFSSSFLGQQLAPNTPITAFHDRGDLRRDYLQNVTFANKFGKSWFKGYLPTLQSRGKWRIACQNLAEGQLVYLEMLRIPTSVEPTGWEETIFYWLGRDYVRTYSSIKMFYFVIMKLFLVLYCKLLNLRFFLYMDERIMLNEGFDTV